MSRGHVAVLYNVGLVGYAQAVMTTFETLDAALKSHADLVSTAIHHVLARYEDVPDGFYDLVRYHLGLLDADFRPIDGRPGGKGLRAGLVMLLAETFGGAAAAKGAAPFAAAVELLHNFSLLHDDIEDGSTTRRHRPTVWSLWGAPLAINAGDGLYALAHVALLDAPLRHAAPATFIDVMEHFENATLRLCEGQHLDMVLEDQDVAAVTVETYLNMIGGKSASLIGSSSWMGAVAGGASAAQADLAYRWGVQIGMAFQMQDDVLGIWGDEGVTGKSAAGDIASRKKTLPILLALAHATPSESELLRDLYRARQGDHHDDAGVLALLDRVGARSLTREYLTRYQYDAAQALASLDITPRARAILAEFAQRFVDRTA